MPAIFPFQFNFDEDDDLFLLSQMARPRYAIGGTQEGMFNLYLNYTTPVTVANTVIETSLLGAPDFGSSKTITPGLAAVGRTFRHFYSGVFSSTGAATLSIRLKLGGIGGTLLETYTPTLPAIAVTAWVLDVFTVISAIGAGGAVDVQPTGFAFALATQGATQWSGRNTASVAVNLASSIDWTLTAQWSAAAAGDSFTYRFGCIDVVR